MSVAFVGCNKIEDNVYELTFSASHGVTQENQFCNPYGYYGWSVDDEDSNSKYDKSGYVIRGTVSEKTTAKTGDWVYIYISVNDVFDYGSVSCTSSDGSINLWAYTDNLYTSDTDNETIKSMDLNLNGKDTTILVKEVKFKL